MQTQSSSAVQLPSRSSRVHWLPDQKGAWMMAVIPFLSGAIGGGFTWQHLPLLALWISGYALFYALNLWLSSKRQPRFRPPVTLWSTISVLLAALNLWLCGSLISWLVFFIPLFGVALWAMLTHRGRTLLARSVEVMAAGLMCLVAWDAGMRLHGPFGTVVSDLGITPPAGITIADLTQWGPLPAVLLAPNAVEAIAVTIALTYYFWSTIPFVKSLVRERSSRSYAILTKISHWVGLVAAIAAWAFQIFDWRMTFIWSILIIRWMYFTHIAHPQTRGSARSQASDTAHPQADSTAHPRPNRTVNARQLLICVGITETVLSILYMGAVLA